MKLTCWAQYISAVTFGSKFAQRLSPTALRTLGFCVPPVCQSQREMISQIVRNFVKRLSSLPVTVLPKVMTFLEDMLCKQDVPVTGEMTTPKSFKQPLNEGTGETTATTNHLKRC
ncbi:hypothetical protein HPB50_020222 [Hyalomma asiaticum]|uniref:Uncharacterized protein n=1 Tax=Hyalomma asiaticum TaxID=266040 RepID=A0ACB7T731_HYAAI|nr:hypothetical protein HPB50_020222 [Hyalomma asiaticum]